MKENISSIHRAPALSPPRYLNKLPFHLKYLQCRSAPLLPKMITYKSKDFSRAHFGHICHFFGQNSGLQVIQQILFYHCTKQVPELNCYSMYVYIFPKRLCGVLCDYLVKEILKFTYYSYELYVFTSVQVGLISKATKFFAPLS